MKKSKAYYLMDAAAVVSTMVDKTKITSERQARELARVEPARREEVIRAADKRHGHRR
jgi:hypothetical protein